MRRSIRTVSLFLCWCLATSVHGLSFGSDGSAQPKKITAPENLAGLVKRIELDEEPLTAEEREEILIYALNPALPVEQAAPLLFAHILSSSKSETAGVEVARHVDKIETRLRSVADIDLWGRLVGSLAFAFEEEKLGDALEEKWFQKIEKESATRQIAFFSALAPVKWPSPKKRLSRLAAAYNCEDLSQESRERIVDIVYAGLSTSQFEVSRACLFYRDLASSKYTSPALTMHMFEQLADIARQIEVFSK